MAIGFSILAVILLGLSFMEVLSGSNGNYEVVVTPEALTMILDETQYITEGTTEIVVMDLRDREDYETSHLSNAVNVPYDDEGVNLLRYLERKKYQNTPIYLMCYSGLRSGKAFNQLKENDFKELYYVSFGFDEYKATINNEATFTAGKCPCELEEYQD